METETDGGIETESGDEIRQYFVLKKKRWTVSQTVPGGMLGQRYELKRHFL